MEDFTEKKEEIEPLEDSFLYDINLILEKIERKLKKYEKYPDILDIQQLIKDRIEDSKITIIGKQDLLNRQKEHFREIKELTQIQKNYYQDELWAEVISILIMYGSKIEENERQIMRANYNLQSNNEIFRIFDMIYNNNFSNYNSQVIDENNFVLKINIAMFLINYSFEKLLLDTKNIIINYLKKLEKNEFSNIEDFKSLSLSQREELVNIILSKIPDLQVVGDILGELKCFDDKGELTQIFKTKKK